MQELILIAAGVLLGFLVHMYLTIHSKVIKRTRKEKEQADEIKRKKKEEENRRNAMESVEEIKKWFEIGMSAAKIFGIGQVISDSESPTPKQENKKDSTPKQENKKDSTPVKSYPNFDEIMKKLVKESDLEEVMKNLSKAANTEEVLAFLLNRDVENSKQK